MMPDRILDPKKLGLNPTRPPGQSPYAVAMKKKPAGAIVPVRPDPGQSQPEFDVEPSMGADPMAGAPPKPAIFQHGQRAFFGPGAEDISQNKYSQDFSHGRSMNVYQDPLSYETNQNTVMHSPLMQEMAAGLDREKQLREDFLRNAPAQEDLSPMMALADYLAKGKGTAQKGYTKPSSYEDAVASIRGLLGDEQKSRYNMTELAAQQTGGLKSGTEETAGKTAAEQGRDQGYKVPRPPTAGLTMPFNQAQGIGQAYEKAAHDLNDKIKNAQVAKQNLANPNWYTSNALKGSIVQGIGVNRLTQNELFLLGQGSQAWGDQLLRAVQKAQNGDALLLSDRHVIEQATDRILQQAIKDRDEIKRSMGSGYNGITVLNPNQVQGVMGGRDFPVDQQPPEKSEDSRALDFAREFLKGGR